MLDKLSDGNKDEQNRASANSWNSWQMSSPWQTARTDSHEQLPSLILGWFQLDRSSLREQGHLKVLQHANGSVEKNAFVCCWACSKTTLSRAMTSNILVPVIMVLSHLDDYDLDDSQH